MKSIVLVVVVFVTLVAIVYGLRSARSKTQPKNPPVNIVMVEKLTTKHEDEVRHALGKYFSPDEIISDIQFQQEGIFFKLNGKDVVFGFMDVPVPWSELEGPCATSMLWPQACSDIKTHRAHIVVALLDKTGDWLERILSLTRLTAAASSLFEAIGIYGGAGGLVIRSDYYEERALQAKVEALPVELWIEYRIQRNPDGTSNMLTTGLHVFEKMEIEVHNSSQKPSDLLDFLWQVSLMLIQGEVFAEGDTLGPDETTRYQIHFVPSVWERPGNVMRIEM